MIMTEYIKIFEDYLKKELKYIKPENLYNPVKYLLESGGKRLRPIIALHVSELLGGKISDTLPAAAALEIFTISLWHMMISWIILCCEEVKRL